MRRIALAVVISVLGARAASAQAAPPGAAAKRAAQNAANATTAHIVAEQRTSDPAVEPQSKKTPVATGSSSAPVTKAPAVPAPGRSAKPAQDRLNVVAGSDTAAPPTSFMRELFEYSRNGRRDPYVSLLTTSELRPTMSDLKLTTIIFDITGRHSLAVMRDVGTNEQYRVGTGAVLGRMRVTAIRPKVIVFTIDEFGTNRQDSLVLGDTTKARVR